MANYAQPRDWWRSSKSISEGHPLRLGVHLHRCSLQIIDSEDVRGDRARQDRVLGRQDPLGEPIRTRTRASGVVRFYQRQVAHATDQLH